jgi:hypothetical protein
MPINGTNRRAFIAALGGAAAWPLVARGQQRVRRIGVLVLGSKPSKDFELIRELERIGYIDERDIVCTIQGANGDVDRLPPARAGSGGNKAGGHRRFNDARGFCAAE